MLFTHLKVRGRLGKEDVRELVRMYHNLGAERRWREKRTAPCASQGSEGPVHPVISADTALLEAEMEGILGTESDASDPEFGALSEDELSEGYEMGTGAGA